ncbi:phage tail protein [Chromobacterium vaccinii]|uniref:phage tail protein n=1 Tax=Chromobacterium vaccinii TaxID=1108595 RepID=UPI00345AF95E
MEAIDWLKLGAEGAARAAGVARLPGAALDVAGAVKQAASAGEMVSKAASLLSAGAPLVGGQARTVHRLSGVLAMASKDLTGSSHELLRAAGQELTRSHNRLAQVVGHMANGWVNQASPVSSQVKALAGKGPLPAVMSSGALLAGMAPMLSPPIGGGGFLLEISTERGGRFQFALRRASYDSLVRDTSFNIADQDRLTRRPAEQAVAKGKDSITLKGAIYLAQHGAGHVDALRAIGDALEPVTLTTGYGEHLGRWYLTRVQEEQSHLFADGAPRKQAFSLEFTRYGEDYRNV